MRRFRSYSRRLSDLHRLQSFKRTSLQAAIVWKKQILTIAKKLRKQHSGLLAQLGSFNIEISGETRFAFITHGAGKEELFTAIMA